MKSLPNLEQKFDSTPDPIVYSTKTRLLPLQVILGPVHPSVEHMVSVSPDGKYPLLQEYWAVVLTGYVPFISDPFLYSILPFDGACRPGQFATKKLIFTHKMVIWANFGWKGGKKHKPKSFCAKEGCMCWPLSLSCTYWLTWNTRRFTNFSCNNEHSKYEYTKRNSSV